MDSQNIIFIHSRHSNLCNFLMEKLMRYNINFITPISVDKIEIKNRILKSKYNIKYVPTVIIFSKPNAEILEGEKAALFIESIIQKIEEKNTPKQIEKEVEVQVQEPKKKVRIEEPSRKKGMTTIDELYEDDEDEDEDERQVLNKKMGEMDNRGRNPYKKNTPPMTQNSAYTEEVIEKSLSDKKIDITAVAKEMEKMRSSEIKDTTSPN